MAQIALASCFEGDFILKLVVVDEDDDMDIVARKTADHSEGRTVREPSPQDRLRPLRVRLQGSDGPFPREATPRSVGLGALDCIEVYREPSGNPDWPRATAEGV